MKLFFTSITTLLLISGAVKAQKNPTWFDIALTGSGGGCMLTSKNMFKDTKTVTSKPAFCYGFGGKFGINFTEMHELAFNAEYSSRTQAYGVKLDSTSFDKSIAMKGVDLSMLYRFRGKESSGYMEVGPMMSFVGSANQTKDGIDSDVKDQFQPKYFSGVLGFGGNIVYSNAFTWIAGFRFTTCFSDMISDAGGKGNNISYPLNDKGFSKDFGSYTAFKATTIQLHTEFTFDLGYFVRSSCKRGRVAFIR